MRAVIFNRHGGTEVLEHVEDFPLPELPAGYARVRVAATSLNRVDLVLRAGYPGLQIPLPHVPGGDVAGVVAELGEGVTGVTPGSRVLVYPIVSCGDCPLCAQGRRHLCVQFKNLGMHLRGGYAEYVAVPAANLIPLPDALRFEDAVALPVAGLTAFHALVGLADLQAGQTVFLWGGAGGLGSMAIAIAKAVGAKVVATAGSDARVALLRELGADLALHRDDPELVARVRAFAPAGVDAAIDYVGPATFGTSFELLRKGGTLLICGMLTGRETTINLHLTYLKHVNIQGLYMGTRDELQTLVDWTAAGKLRPHLGAVLPLAQAAEAQRRMQDGEHQGKIVLRVAEL